MLVRNQICEDLKAHLAQNIEATILLDDILTYDIANAPFVIISQKDTTIQTPSSGSWKHNMEIDIEIIATSKAKCDEILSLCLMRLESFGGVLSVNNITNQKDQISQSEVYSTTISLEIIYFTPSFRA